MAKSGFDEFKKTVADFRSLGSLSVKGVVALPLLTAWVKVGPPPRQTVAILSSVISLLTIIWIFHFYSGEAIVKMRRILKMALGCFCTTLVLCLIFLEVFTISPKSGGESIVVGFQLRPEVVALLNANPQMSKWDALREAEYDPELVWTRESVATMRVILPVLWVSAFASLTAYLLSFIIAQRSAAATKTNIRPI